MKVRTVSSTGRSVRRTRLLLFCVKDVLTEAVRRGSWFYPDGTSLRPCEETLAAQLEEVLAKRSETLFAQMLMLIRVTWKQSHGYTRVSNFDILTLTFQTDELE